MVAWLLACDLSAVRVPSTREALLEWADEDGAVFDDAVELLDAVRGTTLRFGVRVGGAGPSYWHEQTKFLRFWSSPTERLRMLAIKGDAIRGRVTAGAVDEVRITGRTLRFRVARSWITLSAKTAFDVRYLGTVSRKKVLRLDPRSITALGSMRITPRDLPGDVYDNWIGSGEMTGSAFIRRKKPRRAPRDAMLDGAWLVMPRAARPDPASGVWVTGHGEGKSSDVYLGRSKASDELWFAVIRALGDVAHARCGNVLLTGDELKKLASPG